MNHLHRLLVRSAAIGLLAAPVLARPDVPCADEGHCHLPRWSSPTLQIDGHFGDAVAGDASLLMVGEPGADRVHVYRRIGVAWQHAQTIDCPSGTGASFGESLDFSFPRLIVGAPDDDSAAPDAGAAYVFELSGIDFDHVATFVSSVPTTGANFGESVALSNVWAAVGEPQGGTGGRFATFHRVAAVWSTAQTISLAGAGALGCSLALDGDELVVGNWSDDVVGINSGAVHFHRLFPAGATPAIILRKNGASAGDQFGWSVDLDGGRLVVGALGDDSAAFQTGAAYVFQRVGAAGPTFANYTQLALLTPCRTQAGAGFGFAVSIKGDRIAVGAPDLNTASLPGGCVYTYERQVIFNETWPIADEFRAADCGNGDDFGAAVRVNSSFVFVGARNVDDGSSNTGAAYFVTTTPNLAQPTQCPCDAIAAHTSFWTGKPGQLGVPVLELARELVPGESTLVRVTNVATGTLPVLLWGLQPAELPFDGGLLLMADPNLIPMPVVGALNQVGKTVSVPSGICGLIVSLQVMVLDPGAGGDLGTAQSNGVLAYIGF